ncbi:MAG TPA: CARDB domain-containing protein, partial [Candidatus Bathyarchaeia archaeon]
ADVQLLLFINGTTADSVTVPMLNFTQSYTLNLPWTPDGPGVYNVTAYAQPKIGETSSDNNIVTKFVVVETPPVGVKTGDWFNLFYTFTGWPAGQPYLESYKIEFLNVTGTDALVQTTRHLSNGTETTVSGNIDIMAGDTDFVIPNNVEVGDYVYINGVGNFLIVGEETRTCAGADRTVLYTNASQYQTQYFWDKSTGALVEVQKWSGSSSFVATISETNLWTSTIPELPFSSTLILCLTVAFAFVTLLGKRFGKRASPNFANFDGGNSSTRYQRCFLELLQPEEVLVSSIFIRVTKSRVLF